MDIVGAELLPTQLVTYLQHHSDGLLTVGKCVQDLSVKMDAKMTVHMTRTENDEFLQIQCDTESVVDDVGLFVAVQKLRFERMLNELQAGTQVSISHLFRNNETGDMITTIQGVLGRLTELRTRYRNFKDRLVQNMQDDGRSTKKWWKDFLKWTAGFIACAWAIGAVVLVIMHFIPGVDVCLVGMELTGACCHAACAAAGAVVVFMQKDEIDRAMIYIDKISENLISMKETLMQLQAGQDFLQSDEEVEEVRKILKIMQMRCDDVTGWCAKARRI